MLPWSGVSLPASILSKVVLPEPFIPTRPIRSCGSTRKAAPSKMSSAPYDLLTWSTMSIDIAPLVYARLPSAASRESDQLLVGSGVDRRGVAYVMLRSVRVRQEVKGI